MLQLTQPNASPWISWWGCPTQALDLLFPLPSASTGSHKPTLSYLGHFFPISARLLIVSIVRNQLLTWGSKSHLRNGLKRKTMNSPRPVLCRRRRLRGTSGRRGRACARCHRPIPGGPPPPGGQPPTKNQPINSNTYGHRHNSVDQNLSQFLFGSMFAILSKKHSIDTRYSDIFKFQLE